MAHYRNDFFLDGRIRKGGEDGVKQKENKDSI